MGLDEDDLLKLKEMIEGELHQQPVQQGSGKRRVVRFLVMTGVVIVIGFTGHIFHVEVVAKFGELVISCFYTFLMDEAREGKGSNVVMKLGGLIRRNKSEG